MKSTIRFVMMLAVAAMIASLVAIKPVQAQSSNPFGFSDADAKLLQTAYENVKKLKSFQMDYTLTASVAGVSKTGDGSISVTGSGPFAIDASKATGGMTDISADAGAITMQNTVTAEVTGAKAMKGSLEFRIVDGIFYVKGDQATKGVWYKASLADAIKQGQKSNPMASGSGGAKAQEAIMGLFADPDVQAALPKLLATPGFLTETNTPDTVGDVKVAKITLVIDITKLFASPDAKPIVKALLKLQAAQTGKPATDVTDDQVDQILTLATSLTKKGTISLTWLIGTDDSMFYGVGLSIDAAVDTSMMNPNATGPTTVKADFLVKLSKLNEPVKVDAVPDAIDAPMGGGTMMATPAATAAK